MNYEEYKMIEAGYDPVKPKHDPDPIVNTVIQRMRDRSEEGMKTYNCTMMREDLSTPQWIDHAIEELLDAAIYLERLKYDILDK